MENTQLEHDIKYGCNRSRKIDVKSNVKFLDKIKNKTKNTTNNKYYVKQGTKKTIISFIGL